MELLRQSLRWYLIDHPSISGFEWIQNQTPFSSLSFLSTAVFLYLSLTLAVHRHLLPLSPLSPSLLRFFSSLHNLLILLVSLFMAFGCSLASSSISPPSTLFCFPRNKTESRGPLFFYANLYYLSKIYEFIDTLLIVLSGSSNRRLTFLHVYHHAVVTIMAYMWLYAKQSLMPIALITNAAVHVVMYTYYLCSSLGCRWPTPLKKMVTEIQIAQFVFSFLASVVFLWIHFGGANGGEGCEGFNAWVFNAVFNASLLVLFFDFHAGVYRKKKKMEKKEI